MKRAAFTMLELVMVIVVLGILASLAMPRLERDVRQEAIDTILSNIRYTQHLALTDNKHMFNDAQWQRRWWRIVFGTCTGTDRFFMVGSDDDRTGSPNAFFTLAEAATDPRSGKPLFWTNGQNCSGNAASKPAMNNSSEDIFISKKYSVTNVVSGGSCVNAAHIAFDNFGRPHNGVGFSNSAQPNYASLITIPCTFTFTLSQGATFIIQIEPETGHAFETVQINL